MTDRQNDGFSRQKFGFGRTGEVPDIDSLQSAFWQSTDSTVRGIFLPGHFISGHVCRSLHVLEDKALADGPEPDLSACGFDPAAEIGDDCAEAVSADVGLALIQDSRRGAGFYKGLQDVPGTSCPVVDLSIELAVGKGSRTAFSELYI